MFTGIIERLGRVVDVAESDAGRSLAIEGVTGVPIGGSVSINGACLTVVGCEGDVAHFQVVPETLRRTNLGELHKGDRVNLERAMGAGDLFDGHIVQGHVDALGTVESINHDDGGVVMTIATQPELLNQVVEKGSITVDGVSLTVASVDDAGFRVALIPHTLDVTTLGHLQPGDKVNIETDVLAKYVEKMMRVRT